ncbi:hypothetical protein SDC9_179109 [bioreactor metagenome]|uniref:Uncharacterized protein n=1 Tax=bioreactor metagenome TaxID=1076179 RepID=A0A645GXU5_9ZZZZ
MKRQTHSILLYLFAFLLIIFSSFYIFAKENKTINPRIIIETRTQENKKYVSYNYGKTFHEYLEYHTIIETLSNGIKRISYDRGKTWKVLLDIDSIKLISLFPYSNDGLLSVNILADKNNISKFEIISLGGNIIRTINVTDDQLSYKIAVDNLKSGNYYLLATANNGFSECKLFHKR